MTEHTGGYTLFSPNNSRGHVGEFCEQKDRSLICTYRTEDAEQSLFDSCDVLSEIGVIDGITSR
jgi:hypothetical protein